MPACVNGLMRMCEMNLWMDSYSYSTTLTLFPISMVQGYQIYKDIWPVINTRSVKVISMCSYKVER